MKIETWQQMKSAKEKAWEELIEIEINRNGQKAETSRIPILKYQE